MQMVLHVDIDAPHDEVFARFTDFANAADRIDGIKDLTVLTDGPIGNGTRFRETRVMFNRETTEEMEICAFNAPHGYAVTAHSCGADFRTQFDFTPHGDATQVTMTVDTRPVSMFAKLMSPLGKLMAGSMKKVMQQDLDDLKRGLETDGAA